MRGRLTAFGLGAATAALAVHGVAQVQRLNPMIALHEKQLPVFGITHPPIVAGGGRGRSMPG